MNTRHNQVATVAVLFDPDGGEHPCMALSDGRYWAAGRIAGTPGQLANLLHERWFDVSPDGESAYARQERCFGEEP